MFGKHAPAGELAVAHAYATLWRPIDGLRFVAGFYEHCSPADRGAALAYAARLPHTSPDANCMLLADVDRNGEVEVTTWNGVSWERSVVPAALSVPDVVLVRVLK